MDQYLVGETSELLIEAMRWLRDEAMLDVPALRCLPLDREKFPQNSRFAPMFDSVLRSFQEEALLPTFDGGQVTAMQAKLARSQDLREHFSPEQVATIFNSEVANWLSADITQDKAPEIRQYLMRELGIDEITPAKLVPSLRKRGRTPTTKQQPPPPRVHWAHGSVFLMLQHYFVVAEAITATLNLSTVSPITPTGNFRRPTRGDTRQRKRIVSP